MRVIYNSNRNISLSNSVQTQELRPLKSFIVNPSINHKMPQGITFKAVF